MVEVLQLHATLVSALSRYAFVRPYADLVSQVAIELQPSSAEVATRFSWLHTATIWRESQWGLADTLQPKGLTGRGDWAPRARTAAWASARPWIGVRGPALDKATGEQRTSKAGELLYLVLPAAGGWGVGPGQLDEEAHHDLVAVMLNGRPAWQDPLWHLRETGKILAQGLADFPGDEHGAVASYNAGKRNVLLAEASGDHDPDQATTGHDYSKYIISRADRWSSAP